MSRVSYVMMNPGGDAELTAARARGDRRACRRRRRARPASRRNDILEMTVVGNPIMHHLFLGLDPTELGGAPFALTIDGAYEARAPRPRPAARARAPTSTCCPASPAMSAPTPPASCSPKGPISSPRSTLLVDVGTNAEIVLGNRDRLLACSSPTGPAFEGGQISSGQRAAPGAIERVRIDPDDARAALQGDRLRSVVGRAGLRRGDGGDRRHRHLRLRHHRGHRRDVPRRHRSRRTAWSTARWPPARRASRATGAPSAYLLREGEPRIAITQNDVRAIQLAKAALYAGVRC